jgi:hypothetical protein
MKSRILLTIAVLACCPYVLAQSQGSALPHLEKHGTATQLVVDGKPFLVFSYLTAMQPHLSF